MPGKADYGHAMSITARAYPREIRLTGDACSYNESKNFSNPLDTTVEGQRLT